VVAPIPPNAIAAPKLATVVARQIEDQVVDLGWPVGEVLGSEADLLERFGVSRAVLREAVRIVEHTGAAQMRRGPGGGLVVAEPNRDSISTSIAIWFSYVGVTVREMFDARIPLMVEAVRRGTEQRQRDAIAAVRKQIAEMEASGDVGDDAFLDLDGQLAMLSDNPGVILFAEALSSMIRSRLRAGRARLEPRSTEQDTLRHLAGYALLADRIDAGDINAATHQAERLYGAVRDRLKDRPASPQRPPRIDDQPPKLAERVAVALRDDIEAAGWPIDTVLGSEPELIQRYDVSRAILREAVRILEHDGVVRTKRGPGGGLVVSAPDSVAIVRAAGLLLEHDRVTAQQLVDVRSALEVAAVRMTAQSASPAVADSVMASVELELAGGDTAINLYDVHHCIAEASGCRPLALFVRVMSELVARHTQPDARHGSSLPKIAAETNLAHRRIAEAIADGNADLAEKRMRRHLSAALEVMR
jgi:DNA-binding FadR family transcriptional regulator